MNHECLSVFDIKKDSGLLLSRGMICSARETQENDTIFTHDWFRLQNHYL